MTKYIFAQGVVSIDPSVYTSIDEPDKKEAFRGVLIVAPRNHSQESEDTNNPAHDDQEEVEGIDTAIKPNPQTV